VTSRTSVDLRGRFRLVSEACAGGVVVLGTVVLGSWLTNRAALASLHASLAPMKPNTALLFVFLGAALWCTIHPHLRTARRLFGALIMLVAVLTLAEYLFHSDFGIDELLFRDLRASGATTAPGRMTPATVLNFLLFGLAVLFAETPQAQFFRQASIAVVAASAFLALCGYVFGVTPLHVMGPNGAVPIHTAIGFLAASVAYVCGRPHEGVMPLLASDTRAGSLVRRRIPFVILVPITIGGLRLLGQHAGLYDSPFGSAILVVANVAALGLITWRVAALLQASELERSRADANLTAWGHELSDAEHAARQTAILIRELKLAEDALREQVALLDGAQRIGRMGSWSLDPRSGRLVWPEATCELSGITQAEFAGTFDHFHSFMLPEDMPAYDAARARASAAEPLLEAEYRIRRPDGEVRWMYERGNLEFDTDGTPVGRLGMVMDITEQQAAHEQLAKNEAMLRIAGKAARLGGWTIELPERTLTWSDENCAIHDTPPGYKPTLEEGIGFYPEEYRARVARYVEACVEDGTSYDFELPKITATGRQIWVRSIGEAVRDEEGRITRIQGAFQDISDRRQAQQALLQSEAENRALTERRRAEEQFRLLIEATPTGMLMADPSGRIALVNRQVERMFGYDRSELIGQPVVKLVPERFRKRHGEMRDEFFRHPIAKSMGAGKEMLGLRRDGGEVPIEIGLNPIETADGQFVLGSIVDITERNRAEREKNSLVTELEALTRSLEERVEDRTRDARDSQERYRALFAESPIALWELDCSDTARAVREIQASVAGSFADYLSASPDAVKALSATVRVVAVNRRTLELFEAEDEAQLLQARARAFDPETLDNFRLRIGALLDGQAAFETETVRQTLRGQRRVISLRQNALPGHERTWARVVISMIDITASKEAERLLRESLHQQEVLLKEIHHRVKNNLAVISSLFYLESTYATDAHAVTVFEESQRRVRSMALVHETLYGSGNLAEIDFADYARILTSEVLASHRLPELRVQLATNLEPMKMSIDLAVPCGLILNELLSNAFKHAFTHGGDGKITVTLRQGAAGTGLLDVADDGVGLPAALNIETHASLGLRLIRSLVRQVRGTFELFPRHPGTEARVTFSLEEHG
jgi:PAS domain S-box-containing protein